MVPNKSSRGLLIGLIAAHVFGTLIAYTVYIKSSLDGISPSLMQPQGNYTKVNFLQRYLYGLFTTMLVKCSLFLAPMFFGVIIAILIWNCSQCIYLHGKETFLGL